MLCQISSSGFSSAGMILKKTKGQNDISQGKVNISHQKDRVILRKQRRLLSIKDIGMYTQIGKD